MAIGQHVAKALAEKELRDNPPEPVMAVAEEPAIEPVVEPPAPAPAPQMIGLTLEQLQLLIASAKGDSAPMAEALMALTKSVQKEMPENREAPGVSAYNPAGDRDHPRPALAARQFWFGGFKEEADQLSVEEITLINELRPGEYTVTRVDDRQEIVPVLHQKDAAGRLDRIVIAIKTGKEHQAAWPSKLRILREIVSQQLVEA
jgi:hypothetical protein